MIKNRKNLEVYFWTYTAWALRSRWQGSWIKVSFFVLFLTIFRVLPRRKRWNRIRVGASGNKNSTRSWKWWWWWLMRDVGVVEHSRAAVFLVVGGRKQRNLSSLFVEKWKSFTWLAREEGRETEKKFSQDSLFFTVAVFFHYTFLRTSMLDFW